MSTGLRVLLVLLAISLFSAAVTGAEIYFRATYLWVVFLAVNWVWARLSLWGLSVRRIARTQRAEMGQVLEERFVLRNQRRLRRLWVEVRDESALPGASGSQVFSNLRKGEERSYISRLRLLQRGVFVLGPTVLASSDLFGIFPLERVFPATHSLTVYPLMVHLRAFPEPAGLLPGGQTLRRRTAQAATNAAGVREYAPGDPLNRIHWPSTARRERLMVKEFEIDPQAEVWIFLDGEAAVHARKAWKAHLAALWYAQDSAPLPPDTAEYAASIAASLARYYLEQRRAVGLASHGREALVLPAEQGNRQLLKVLDTLALWQPRGALPLSGMVEAQAAHLPRGSTAIIITPSPRPQVALAAEYLRARGLRPVMVLLDAHSFGGAEGSQVLARQLAAMQVTVRRVACGDDLQQALEMPLRL